MAKVTGFLEHDRAESKSVAPKSRLRNFDEFVLPFPEKTLNELYQRTGLQSNPNRFSGGFEFSGIDKMDIAYSFLTHHVLSTTHQFSITVNF